MDAFKKSGLLDFFVLLVRWKKLITLITVLSIALGYLAIYLFIDVEYESTTVILPREDRSFGALSGLKKGLSGLPAALGGKTQNDDMDFFTTIVYSRTALEELITTFKLDSVYKVNKSKPTWKEQLILRLRKDIMAKESKNASFEITVTSTGSQLSSDMANYLVLILNRTIVKTQSQKSHDNRVFLEKRVQETKQALKQSEDSLRMFQEASGIFEPKEQTRLLLGTFAELESKLMAKEVEKSVAERLYEKNSPQTDLINAQLDEYKKKLAEEKIGSNPKSLAGGLSAVPAKWEKYVRLYREISMNNTVLEFLVPLYEQSKFDEQRDLPMLNVIDEAVPAMKKSFPPRMVFALLIGFGAFIITMFFIMLSENEKIQNSEKIRYIRQNLWKWSANS